MFVQLAWPWARGHERKTPRGWLQQPRGGKTHSGGSHPNGGPSNPHSSGPAPRRRRGRRMSAVDLTEARRQRGLAIAAICRITRDDDLWYVPSQTGTGKYLVTVGDTPSCTCK